MFAHKEFRLESEILAAARRAVKIGKNLCLLGELCESPFLKFPKTTLRKIMLEFIKNTFSSVLGTLIALFLMVFLGFLFLIGIAQFIQPTEPKVPESALLVVNLSLSINDKPPTSSIDQAIEEAIRSSQIKRVGLRNLLNAIEFAKEDDRIKGIFLHGNLKSVNYGSGYAALKEVRGALDGFKESGKGVYAYILNASPRDYYLMSVADRAAMNPFGELYFNGLGAEVMFFSNALKKWGVGVQPVRAGKYKSGIEPFVREDMSEEYRLQVDEMLRELWDTMAEAVAESRGITVDHLNAAANRNRSFRAEEALAAGLVDELVYFDEVLDQLKEVAGDDDDERTFTQVKLADYIKANPVNGSSRSKNKIAVVYVEGVIVGEGGSDQAIGKKIARRLRDVRLDDSVKAVVLRVNSPGGGAQASEIIQREVRLLREAKPVVASMGFVAASGGYWVSTYADKIFAQANTITGSIGVYGIILNVQEIAGNIGLAWDYATTHDYAGSWTITRPQTEPEMDQIVETVDWFYDMFLQKVADSRDKEINYIDSVAQGRVWMGREALKIGLVDEIGGLEDAIAEAVEMADVGSDYRVVDYPRAHQLEEVIQALLEGRDLDVSIDPYKRVTQRIENELEWLKAFDDPQGIYLLPEIHFQLF